MVGIKICGLQRDEDIEYVNQLKPEYVGFVFAQSKRQIDPYIASHLINKLDKEIKVVGVFLNHSIKEVKEIEKLCNFDIFQFHGDEEPNYCNYFEKEVWKSFCINNKESLKLLEKYNVDKYLFDTCIEGKTGGTGEIFNWELVREISKTKDIVLAGGLSSENIIDAIEIVSPAVVDVSSGVETEAFKDYNKIKNFIKKVRG